MNRLLILSLVIGVSSLQARAQETSESESRSKAKLEDVTGKKNKVEGDIDEEITNAKMRAESGSKSKVSLSMSLGYTGGAISRPFGVDRPKLEAEPGIQDSASADLGIDARYRFTKNDSVTLGTSFGIMTPFQGDVSGDEKQLNVFDPNLGYNRTFSAAGLQNSISASLSAGTSNESKGIDLDFYPNLGVTTLKSMANGLTTGLSVSVIYFHYDSAPGENEAGTARPGYYGGDRRSDYKLGVYPFAEYSFNDRFSARTVFGYFNWKHLYGDSKTTRLLKSFVYQSVGVGISLTRDIYLYPNVQFVPDNIRSDFTNVAMSATLNVF